MATAQIYVDAAVGRPAVVKALATPAVNLTNFDNTGVATWTWTKVQTPPGSAATFSDPAIAAPTFGPFDLPGTYWIRLAVNAAAGDWQSDAEVDEIVIRVRTAVLGLVYPAIGETTQGSLTTGWADWASGMNDALARIAAMTAGTLQATYDASAPPRIQIDPAAGPVTILRRTASPGNALVVSDEFGSRIVLSSYGRLSLTASIAAGTPGIAMTGTGTTGYLMRLLGAATREFSVGWDGAGAGIAVAGLGSPLWGYELSAQGFASGIFRAYNPAVGGGDLRLDSSGAVRAYSAAPVTAFAVESNIPTGNLAYFQNVGAVGLAMFSVFPDSSLQVFVDTASANVALDVCSPGNTNQLFRFLDPVGGGQMQLAPNGRVATTQNLAAGQVGQDWLVAIAAGTPDLLRIRTAAGNTYLWDVYSQVVQTVERMVLRNATAKSYYHTIDCSLPAAAYTIDKGGVVVGYHFYSSTWALTAEGELEAYRADLRNAVGAAANTPITGFKAVLPNQAAHGFRVGIGAGFLDLQGYCRISVGDMVPTPGAGFALALNLATGAASNWYAGIANRSLIVPLRIPHGATLVEVSLHVSAAAAGLTLYLIEQVGVFGAATGDQQVQHASVASADAGEQDLTITALSLPASRAELGAASQNTYYLTVVSSGAATDRIYSGYALFEYNELLLGE